jgi:hypothetical protein
VIIRRSRKRRTNNKEERKLYILAGITYDQRRQETVFSRCLCGESYVKEPALEQEERSMTTGGRIL